MEIWPGLMHVFQALPRLGPEADAALRRVAEFLGDRAADRPPPATAPASLTEADAS